jgi:excisionase family DNA binding protein
MSIFGPTDNGSAPVPRLALTKVEAASCLGVSVEFLEQHVLPEIPAVRGTLIPLAALRQWLDHEPLPAPNEVLTVEETAARVKVSRRTVMRAIKTGQLAASQLNQGRGGWRIYTSAIDEWMRERAAPVRVEARVSVSRRVEPRRPAAPSWRPSAPASSDGRLTP